MKKLILTVLLATTASAIAQTNLPPVPSVDSPAFQPLLALLSGHFGWLPTIIAWIGAIRLPMRIVSEWLKRTMTAFLARINESPETDDDERIGRILGSFWYRMLTFGLDAVLSLKLPTKDSLTLFAVKSVEKTSLPTLVQDTLTPAAPTP